MLKIYDVQSMFQLNNQGEWKSCGYDGYTCKDDNEVQQERIVFNNFSWNQVRDFLKTNHLDGFYNDTTYFRKRPFISISYSWEISRLELFEDSVDTISYKHVYTERKDVTLDWIVKHCSADKAITYLKQRGINTCPILK